MSRTKGLTVPQRRMLRAIVKHGPIARPRDLGTNQALFVLFAAGYVQWAGTAAVATDAGRAEDERGEQ